jgi:hypothetical protein
MPAASAEPIVSVLQWVIRSKLRYVEVVSSERRIQLEEDSHLQCPFSHLPTCVGDIDRWHFRLGVMGYPT